MKHRNNHWTLEYLCPTFRQPIGAENPQESIPKINGSASDGELMIFEPLRWGSEPLQTKPVEMSWAQRPKDFQQQHGRAWPVLVEWFRGWIATAQGLGFWTFDGSTAWIFPKGQWIQQFGRNVDLRISSLGNYETWNIHSSQLLMVFWSKSTNMSQIRGFPHDFLGFS